MKNSKQNWLNLASSSPQAQKAALIFCLLTALAGCSQETSAKTDGSPKALIASIYATPVKNLEQAQGRSNFSRVCVWLTERFSQSILTQDATPCKLKKYDFDFRYPSLTSENIEEIAHEANPPQAQIIEESIEAGKATVKVKVPVGGEFPTARIVYFLAKEETGWKIYNFLSYSTYPLKTSGEYSDCKDMSREYKFAQRPTSAYELQDLPVACRKIEQRTLQSASPAK